jgi:hypothetical protein
MQARMYLESRRYDEVGAALEAALGLLIGIPDVQTEAIRADITALHDESAGAAAAEHIRRIEDDLDRHFVAAEDVQTWRPEYSAGALDRIAERLAAGEVRGALPAAALDRYRTRLAAAAVNHAAVLKADALDRAYPPLRELEQRLATDPFAGLGHDAAYSVRAELRTLKSRALQPLRSLPAEDPDAVVINARLAAADATVEQHSAVWSRARQELYDTLVVEADAAWPAIVAATGATADFDPADTGTDTAGRTVLLPGVYNRSGWDFSDYDFSMRRNGIPVGGSYEPHVRAALEHVWYELELEVDDRISWDVVAVVEGPGKIGERIIMPVTDKRTGLEIGKVEEYRPVDCVRLRITALHAGPVAIGPGR